LAHDDHFHCFAFPAGIKAGPGGSAVRKDTWLRSVFLPGVLPVPVTSLRPDLELYSLTYDLTALVHTQNKKLPQSARLDSLGQTAGGRELHVLKLGANINDKPKTARVLFTGGLHAREWLGPTYTYLIAEWLVTNYPTSPGGGPNPAFAKDLLDNNHIWLVPMCNPDGHEYTVTTERMHRKNSPGGDSHFQSAPGAKPARDAKAPPSIDLNRNFATKQWQAIIDSKKGSFSAKEDGDTFAGKSAASATEVQLLQKMIDATPFDLAVDHHTYDCALLYPYGDDPGKAKQNKRLVAFSGLMQKQINRKAAKNITTQPGTADNWSLYKISSFYADLYKSLGITPGLSPEQSLIPGSITDYIIYAAEGASPPRKTLAWSMELPPMHHAGSPGFNPPESIIRPAFNQLIGTSLALIKNATADDPKAADFSLFDIVAP